MIDRTHTIRVMHRAQHDLVEIDEYMQVETPLTADAFIDGLYDAIESLARFPTRGARPRDPRLRTRGYRFLTHERYLIFYKIKGAQVRVARVLHGQRAYADILR